MSHSEVNGIKDPVILTVNRKFLIILLVCFLALFFLAALSRINMNSVKAVEVQQRSAYQGYILRNATEAATAIRGMLQEDHYAQYDLPLETEQDLIYLDYQIRRMMSHMSAQYRLSERGPRSYEYSDEEGSFDFLFSRIRTDLINAKGLFEDGYSEDGTLLLNELIEQIHSFYDKRGLSFGPHIPEPTFD